MSPGSWRSRRHRETGRSTLQELSCVPIAVKHTLVKGEMTDSGNSGTKFTNYWACLSPPTNKGQSLKFHSSHLHSTAIKSENSQGHAFQKCKSYTTMSKLPQSTFNCKCPQSSLLGITGHVQTLTLQHKEGGSFFY